MVDGTGEAAFVGVHYCDSVWACPVCGPRIWQQQREVVLGEITRLRETHYVLMVLGTIPHTRRDRLANLHDVIDGVMSKTLGSLRRRAKKVGRGIEYIRALEHTHGQQHGWHPHYHGLILIERQPGDDRRDVIAEWSATWRQVWTAKAALAGCRIDERAIGAMEAANPEAAAEYITEDLDSAASELALGQDTKSGGDASRTPFEILEAIAAADVAGIPARADVALWKEYAEATHGKRRLTCSQGISLSLDGEPDTDAEGEGDEEADEAPAAAIAHLGATGWAYLSLRGGVADVLDAVERARPDRRYTAAVLAGEVYGLHREHWRPGLGAAPDDRPHMTAPAGGLAPPDLAAARAWAEDYNDRTDCGLASALRGALVQQAYDRRIPTDRRRGWIDQHLPDVIASCPGVAA